MKVTELSFESDSLKEFYKEKPEYYINKDSVLKNANKRLSDSLFEVAKKHEARMAQSISALLSDNVSLKRS